MFSFRFWFKGFKMVLDYGSRSNGSAIVFKNLNLGLRFGIGSNGLGNKYKSGFRFEFWVCIQIYGPKP